MHRSVILLALLAAGCTAARGTWHLAKAEQAVYQARLAEAPDRALYDWTKAEQFILKAREEWGYADYGPAEDLAKKAVVWAAKADEQAQKLQKSKSLDTVPDTVPEQLDTQKPATDPAIKGRDEKLVVPDDPDEEE